MPDISPFDALLFYVIYRRPLDYPDEYVCRVHTFEGASPNLYARARTLEEIRSKLPRGLTNIQRYMMDDPAIAEVWI